MNKIEIKNLQLLFGAPKDVQKAKQLVDAGKSNKVIREETGVAVGVREVNFNIKEGELFVIVGLSGSGKSSLIRCLNLLNTPTEGTILVDGENILDLKDDALLEYRKHKVSMVFQNFGLLSHRTIIRNVEYGLEIQGIEEKARRKIALEAIETVGLKGWEEYFPSQLSGGMKQRVGLARAIANQPDILLMDEPYSALDPLIRRDMQNELLGLEDYMDKTIVFITHDMNEAFKLGDRIALMKDGVVVQLGKPTDFFDNPASEYVEDFIADVDKTKVLTASQVMSDCEHVLDLDTSIADARKYFNNNDSLEYSFVTTGKNIYKGYITREDLFDSKTKKLDSILCTDVKTFTRHQYLHELITEIDENDVDVPIISKNRVLKGTISGEDIIRLLK